MPLLTRKSVLAAKIETTVGTAIALSASDGACNIYDAKMTPDITADDRIGQGSFSRIPSVPGAYGGTCTFKTDLVGGSTDPFWGTVFLPACGYVGSGGAYSPVTGPPGGAGGVKSLTIGLYENGRVRKMRGCMGNAVFRMTAGKPVMVEFTFRGIFDTPADATILAPTYPTTRPLKFVSSSLAIGSWSPQVSEVVLDLGNNVILREDSSDPSGYVSAIITDMQPKGTMDPEAALVATDDPYGDWLGIVEAALAISLGTTDAGVDFDAPKCQITKVDDGDRNLIRTDPIEFQLNRSASAGDDHLVITFPQS